MDDLLYYLFKTKALDVCEENRPFFYHAGKIGPYFVNTHYLYGSKEAAEKLLLTIDEAKNFPITCPHRVLQETLNNYQNDEIYKTVVNKLCEYIQNEIGIDTFDYISGGERRDWFFSLVVAYLLKKPHLSIFKDQTVVYSSHQAFENKALNQKDGLKGAKVLHIADLLNTASSYTEAWIPAIEKHNGKIVESLVVFNRNENGDQILHNNNINSNELILNSPELFARALMMNVISNKQHQLIIGYLANPDESMTRFLIENPDYVHDALINGEPKDRERAQKLVDKNLYNFNQLHSSRKKKELI